MWGSTNDESMMNTGGGFYNNTENFNSPSTEKKETPRAQSLAPIMIGMIKESQSEDFTIWGMPVSIVKIMGIVRNIEVTSTTVTYEIEDHTGTMKAILWLEEEAASEPNIPVNKTNVYVKIFGTIRTKPEGKILMVLKIVEMAHMNELICHLLEAITVRATAENRSKNESKEIIQNNPGAKLSNSMMTFGGGVDIEDSMTPIQKSVLQFMKSSNNEIGVSRKSILDNFSIDQRSTINDAIEFLIMEGHIYSTINPDHFMITAV